MSRGHNNPLAEERPSPAIDWNAVEWWVYRMTGTGIRSARAAYDYRISARELSPGELREGEELACTATRCSLAAVRKCLREGMIAPEGLQAYIDEIADWNTCRREAEDALATRLARLLGESPVPVYRGRP